MCCFLRFVAISAVVDCVCLVLMPRSLLNIMKLLDGKAGFLTKEGGRFPHRWQKRWFKINDLTGRQLEYATPKGKVGDR